MALRIVTFRADDIIELPLDAGVSRHRALNRPGLPSDVADQVFFTCTHQRQMMLLHIH